MTEILEKIKNKFKQIIINTLIKISLFLYWPQLTAISFWLASSELNPKRESPYTVLCMGRSWFVDDVKAMSVYSGRIKYVTIWKSYFQIVFRHFIKGPEEKLLTDLNYHTKDFCKQGKENYYLFLKKMFPLLHKLINFNAILCSNFGYPDQQEFEKVCSENKVPYIVLLKEGLLPRGTQVIRAIRSLTHFKFRGTAMLVYNQEIKKELLKGDFSNFSNMAENQLKVVGMPRLDNYFALSNDDKKLKKQVLFFSFYPEDKFIYLIEDTEKMNQAYKRIDDFHKWIINFAYKYPEINVIIKAKVAPHYTEYLEKIFRENFKGDIKNLEIMNTGDTFDLIKNSTVIVSFLSTTCLMAIVAKKTLVTPYFGDLIIDREWDYFTDYPELVNYAKSEEDLENYILYSNKYPIVYQEGKNKFLEDYLGNSDGRSSIRAEDAIIDIIK